MEKQICASAEPASTDLETTPGHAFAQFVSDEQSYGPSGTSGGPYTATYANALGQDIFVLSHNCSTAKAAMKAARM